MWRIPYNSACACNLPLPESVDLADFRYVGGEFIAYQGQALYVYELHYHTGARWKRCFVGGPPIETAGNVLAVALPASNSNGDGARDLIDGDDIQFSWPLQLAAEHNACFVAIDGPRFGAFEYEPDNPVDPLVDDLCGILAARYFLEEMPAMRYRRYSQSMFVGGLSWGGIRSTYLAGALKECHVYAAGCQLSKTYDGRPVFNPAAWEPGYDYADMLLLSDAARIRLQFGGNGDDYLYTPFLPGIDSILATVAQDHRISYRVNPDLGHMLDVADLKAAFQAYLAAAPWHVPAPATDPSWP